LKIVLCKGRFAGPISGADETLVAYAIQLKAAGHDVIVAVLYPPSKKDPHWQRLRAASVPVSCIAEKSVMGTAMQFLKKRVPHLPAGPRRALQKVASNVSASYVDLCRAYFERIAPDVIHVMTPDPAVMAMIRAAHAAGIPVLYQELGTPEFLPELHFYYELLREVLPLCDIAALSPDLASRFASKFAGTSSVAVLPLVVEDVPAARTAERSDRVTFGFAGRMEYGKGPLVLLEAFARAHRTTNEISLRIAGDGPQREEARGLAEALSLNGSCSFVGVYSGAAQKSAFMRSIDVLVLPSLAEGTPNSIIEAMAHGLPVIASHVGGIPDIVSPETGILVPSGDVDALTAAMLDLASNEEKRTSMGRAARAQYERIFAPAAVIPVMVDVYERVMKQPARNGRPAHPWIAERSGTDARARTP
jgi:glycosyltransferase involved in cell wall biosynthesis